MPDDEKREVIENLVVKLSLDTTEFDAAVLLVTAALRRLRAVMREVDTGK